MTRWLSQLRDCTECGARILDVVPLGRHAVVWAVRDGRAVKLNCALQEVQP